MMPAYRYMDSPQQITQMPSYPYSYPTIPARSPVSFEPWAYGGYPMPFHSCCNHNYIPHYWPPYPYISPPLHGHGNYPVYPASFHCQYDFPSPYPIEHPRYESEKNMAQKNHCCECPIYAHNWEGDKNVKVKEEEPDTGKKEEGPLEPVGRKSYPYPVLWFPPEYLKDKDDRDEEIRDGHLRQRRHGAKPAGSDESPGIWNHLFPFDRNKIEHLGQGLDNHNQYRKDEEKDNCTQNRQYEDKNSQFPFPIIWMPSHGKPEGIKRTIEDINTAPKFIENAPSKNKAIPMNFSVGDDETSESNGSEDRPRVRDVIDNISNTRSIPVKQISHGDTKANVEADGRGKLRDVAVKEIEDNQCNRSSKTIVKRQSESPAKTSKLPPVCLRVDPLPRKKNGNGVSSFPSPPAQKRNTQALTEPATPAGPKDISEQASQNMEVDSKTSEKMAEAAEKATENKAMESPAMADSMVQIPVNSPASFIEEVSRKGEPTDKGERKENRMENMTSKKAKKEEESEDYKNPDARNGEGQISSVEVKYEHAFKEEKRNLSEAEAAAVIQSAYRGYEVRRFEPLKKLKQLAEVRKEVADVGYHIRALEDSPAMQRDDKKCVIMGETIMSLLLKLDAIQGLHPSIREIRKSVARELTELQEKLDYLSAKRAKRLKQESSAKNVEGASLDPCSNRNIQGEECKEISGGFHNDLVGSFAPIQGQSPKTASDSSDCQPNATELFSTDKVHLDFNKTSKSPMPSDLEPTLAEPEAEIHTMPNSREELMPEILSVEGSLDLNSGLGQSVARKTIKRDVFKESRSEDGEVRDVKSGIAVTDDSSSTNEKGDMNLLAKLPPDVINVANAVPLSEQCEPVGRENSEGERALPCEPVETENCEADLALPLELTQVPLSTYDEGVDIRAEVIPVENSAPIETEAVQSKCENGESGEGKSGISALDYSTRKTENGKTNPWIKLPLDVISESYADPVSEQCKSVETENSEAEQALPCELVDTEKREADLCLPLKLMEVPQSAHDETVTDVGAEVIPGEITVPIEAEILHGVPHRAYLAEVQATSESRKVQLQSEAEERPLTLERDDPMHVTLSKGADLVPLLWEHECDSDEQKESGDDEHPVGDGVSEVKSELAIMVENKGEEVCQHIESAQAPQLMVNSSHDVPLTKEMIPQQSEAVAKGGRGDYKYCLLATENERKLVPDESIKSIKSKSDINTLEQPGQPSELKTIEVDILSQTQAPTKEEENFADSSSYRGISESDKKLTEENEKLKDAMQKLIEAGKEQLSVISNLNRRVKDLEKKLSRKKKLKTRRYRGMPVRSSV